MVDLGGGLGLVFICTAPSCRGGSWFGVIGSCRKQHPALPLPSHVPVPTAHHGHTSPGSTARELFSCDKGIKIAWTDGKHFTERSAEKKGNEAVKKIEHGAGHRRGGGIFLSLQQETWQRQRVFSPTALACCSLRWRLVELQGEPAPLASRATARTLPYIALPFTSRPEPAGPRLLPDPPGRCT